MKKWRAQSTPEQQMFQTRQDVDDLYADDDIHDVGCDVA